MTKGQEKVRQGIYSLMGRILIEMYDQLRRSRTKRFLTCGKSICSFRGIIEREE